MYQITVPLINRNLHRSGREKYVQQLRAMGATRVLLALRVYETTEQWRRNAMQQLRENTAYFKQQGFEVGAWIWAFWCQQQEYTYMAFTTGNVSKRFVCPSDAEFCDFAGAYLQEIAGCGVDIILFDDDYRYGHLDKNGLGCLCQNHRAYMQRILGEALPENLNDYLLTGGKNKYRSAFVAANRHFLLQFAEKMRRAVDAVAPAVRLGVCACMSVWDFDGASPYEIAKALAGGTKPLLRLIGAPYWAVRKNWGNRLQDVIELERMERSWCGDDAEIISEGDVYPRPRYECPASYLEGFDTALRAAGCMDGIMKYVFDYTSTAAYETGYVRSHVENLPVYNGIEEMFAGKTAVGVRVWETMRKYEAMEIPKAAAGKCLYDIFASPAARMLAACTVPTVYEGTGLCGIAFGENAKYLPQEAFSKGLILDARAAEILMQRGVDVGLCEKGEELRLVTKNDYVAEEHFLQEDEYVPAAAPNGAYRLKLKPAAVVQSEFLCDDRAVPASYLYENAAGRRFLVFAFDGYFCRETLYRQYARARQMERVIPWLSGSELPFRCCGNPDLYAVCKQGKGSLSVGLWNFFADSIPQPKIVLDREYASVRFLNCTGTLQGREVTLSKLHAFEFCAFEVE